VSAPSDRIFLRTCLERSGGGIIGRQSFQVNREPAHPHVNAPVNAASRATRGMFASLTPHVTALKIVPGGSLVLFSWLPSIRALHSMAVIPTSPVCARSPATVPALLDELGDGLWDGRAQVLFGLTGPPNALTPSEAAARLRSTGVSIIAR